MRFRHSVVFAVCAALTVALLHGPGVHSSRGDEMLNMVVELLASPDREMRALALQQVREAMPGEAVTQRLVAELPKLPPEGQAGLLEALGDRGDAAARPAMAASLGAEHAAVRAAAVSALAKLGDAGDVPALVKHLADEADTVQAAAWQSLVRLHGEEVNEAVLAAFEEAEPNIRTALLGILARRNAREAVPAVLEAAKDDSAAVRIAAIRALRLLATEEHAGKLVQAVKAARDGAERYQAMLALMAVCGRHRGQSAEAIIAGMEDAEPAATAALLQALARAGGDDALAAVAARLNDENQAVRDAAVRTLAIWNDPAATEHLTHVAKTADDLRHHVVAVRGLARMAQSRPDRPADFEKLGKALELARRNDERQMILAIAEAGGDPAAAAAMRSALDDAEPDESPQPPARPEVEPTVEQPSVAFGRLAEIDIDLPAPAFRGTPVPVAEPNLEEPAGSPRPPFLAPEGTTNLALAMPVSASDPAPVAGELDDITNNDKEASDFGVLELSPGTQWVQIDLGRRATIFAVLVWHNHGEARVYRDVVVQVSDCPDFLEAETLFNNDYNNTSGLGAGSDLGYVETAEGKLIDARGVEGRYVRLYARGNHIDAGNHYTEVAVYGIPLETSE